MAFGLLAGPVVEAEEGENGCYYLGMEASRSSVGPGHTAAITVKEPKNLTRTGGDKGSSKSLNKKFQKVFQELAKLEICNLKGQA